MWRGAEGKVKAGYKVRSRRCELSAMGTSLLSLTTSSNSILVWRMVRNKLRL